MRATISRRPLVFGVVSVLCGLAAFVVGGAAVAGAQRAARADFVSVPVAAGPLPEGTVLEAIDVRRVSMPPDAVPPGLSADPVGRTVTIAMLPGDALVDGKLAPSGRGLSALLLPGEVAATVEPAAPVAAAVGERVRITATFDPGRFKDDNLVREVAASARVLAHGERATSLVVALSPPQRDRLALTSAVARIDVAVVAPGG